MPLRRVPNVERRVRSTDPETSRTAAQGITDTQLSELQRWIVRKLFITECTDEELYVAYTRHAWVNFTQPVTAQRLRTARKELTDQGLVKYTETKRPTVTGFQSQVWGIA